MNKLTTKVINAYSKFDNPRSSELMKGLIEHLHAFVVDVKLTDKEWEFCWNTFKRMSDFTDENRNEFLLMADILGVSQLIEKVNHSHNDAASESALVGPFYRANAPFRNHRDPIMSEETAGERVDINGTVKATDGSAISGAIVDIWQAGTNGLYECEDPNQPDMNLRGRFKTNENGEFSLIALVPTAYPVPNDGPAGDLLKAAKRNIIRPAHIHFIVVADQYETLVTQVFVEGDKQIDDDPVFTANYNMSKKFVLNKDNNSVDCKFTLVSGESIYPEAPIK